MQDIQTSLAPLIREAHEAEATVGYTGALDALERAHLLSQPFPGPHVYVHWLMFRLAFRHGVYKEVLGQIPRLILAMPGSWLGKAPKGNVGSTKMGIFEEK